MLSDPNREYVALCWSSRSIDGKQEKYFYAKKFKLPLSYKETAFAFGAIDIEIPLENTANKASWYFLNKLDYQAAVELVIPASQYENITPVESQYSKIIAGLIEALSNNDLSSKDIVEQLRSDLPTLTTLKEILRGY